MSPLPFDPQEYLAAIITSSDDAIISKDLNGFVTSWNKSAERIFGFTAEEIVGRHITLIIPAERLFEEDTILVTLKTGERVDHFETVRRHKDGHLVPVLLTVSAIRDSTGKIVGASKVSRDISERVAAQKTIREISQKKDDFIANMSHELRTPMNAVIGLAHILQSSKSLSEKDRHFVDTLKISAENLMDLINDLLDFSKIDSGSLELERVDFSVAEQVQKIISIMKVKAQEKNLELAVHYPATEPQYFMGDPLRLHQVLTNLVSNALKFTDKGSVDVAISSEPRPDGKSALLTFKVTDTGIGIPKDKYEAIFEKFTQADSSISRRYGGSGLGLAITRALVEKMNGSITVESNLGVGTCFTVRLPLGYSEQQQPVHTLSSTLAPPRPVQKKNVLLVEDYQANILVASTMLEGLGYDYDVANTGLEAVRAFIQGKYDVILMDVEMHDVDGLVATQRIRQIEKEKNIKPTPIIAMTAHVREQDKARCHEAGMNDFIPKPFEPLMLSKKIARYVLDAGSVSEGKRAAS